MANSHNGIAFKKRPFKRLRLNENLCDLAVG